MWAGVWDGGGYADFDWGVDVEVFGGEGDLGSGSVVLGIVEEGAEAGNCFRTFAQGNGPFVYVLRE